MKVWKKLKSTGNVRTLITLALVTVVTVVTVVTAAGIGLQAASDSIAQEPAAEPTTKVVLISEVKWEKLNPARGEKSPQAGTLWGDRNGIGPTGFLLKPVDGFESPPHIHNVSYRGVVISGLIHNDDPNAADMWMPPGSFWTQPKGEVHITAAKGTDTLAYIEIEEGPYLVLPAKKAFDSGERPVNVDESNIASDLVKSGRREHHLYTHGWQVRSHSGRVTDPDSRNHTGCYIHRSFCILHQKPRQAPILEYYFRCIFSYRVTSIMGFIFS